MYEARQGWGQWQHLLYSSFLALYVLLLAFDYFRDIRLQKIWRGQDKDLFCGSHTVSCEISHLENLGVFIDFTQCHSHGSEFKSPMC